MAAAQEIAREAERRDIRNRWLLSAPALLIILFAATGPLLIVLVYSFLKPGPMAMSSGRFPAMPGPRSSSNATSSTTRCRSPMLMSRSSGAR